MRVLLTLIVAAVAAAAVAIAQEGHPPMKKENRLARSRSPYLLQHKDNPVDWYPWGDEAFERARKEGKPVFLSVGYSACHWCHVMEHESFEDEETARFLNERFVSVKVDREERPDVDDVYMRVTQMTTGGGGWPMTVFMTPDKRPFFAGTYFPKEARFGMISFRKVLERVDDAWRNRRAEIERSADEISRAAAGAEEVPAAPEGVTLSGSIVGAVAASFERRFDAENGGFGGAPKFPPHQVLRLLVEEDGVGEKLLRMALVTLDKMAAGGIHDHLGGGFARYSTDEEWHVPHFEKMLYDNAMLARVYVDAFARTRSEGYRHAANGVFGWVRREMTDPEGGFYSALDADSEGLEGKFYVWTPTQVADVLGKEEGEVFCRAYDVTADGNWATHEHGEGGGSRTPPPGHSIPRLTRSGADPAGLRAAREKLYEARRKRVPPGLDDKVLTAWNGLMIGALARGFAVTGDARLGEAAAKCARFLLTKVSTRDGRLLRSWRKGEAGIAAVLEDYAFLADGLLDLHAATGEREWLEAARRLADRMLDDFEDRERGGFFGTAHDGEALLFRSRDPFDGALPSANGVAARALARLARLAEPALSGAEGPGPSEVEGPAPSGAEGYGAAADRCLRAFAGAIQRAPGGTVTLVQALSLRGEVRPGPVARDAAPVAATARLEGGPARAGGIVTVVVTVSVAAPFHLAAPLAAIEVSSRDFPVEAAGAPQAPAPEAVMLGFDDAPAEVYRGRFEVRVPVRVKPHATVGAGKLRLAIGYQACDDRRCLAPARLYVEAPIEVVP